jgi:hypothetical protein
MTYYPTIPQPGDKPSSSQAQILSNFTVLNTTFGLNHYAFNSGVNAGKHKYSTYFNQAAGPATGATEGALYCKLQSARSGLYFRRESSGSEILMTNKTTPVVAASGCSFLPGGLLIQWGTISVPVGDSGNFNFPAAFSATPYSIQLTFIRSAGASSTNAVYVTSGQVTSTRFRTTTVGTAGAHDVYFMAIGPGI